MNARSSHPQRKERQPSETTPFRAKAEVFNQRWLGVLEVGGHLRHTGRHSYLICVVSTSTNMPRKTDELTRAAIIAEGQIWWDITADTGDTTWAMLSSAANLGGFLPDDLAEVTPFFEVGHIRISLTVLVAEFSDLAVVELIRDDLSNVGSSIAASHVLAVTAAANSTKKNKN